MKRALTALLIGLLAAPSSAAAFPQTYDTDASVYFAQLSINGCVTPSAWFKAAINLYVIGEKIILNWGNQDMEYVLATTDSCTAGTNLAQPGLYNVTWTGACTFSLNGLNGDNSTCYGDTGVNQSVLTRMAQNNAHAESWQDANTTQNFGIIGLTTGLGLSNGTNKTSILTGAAISDTGGGLSGLAFEDRTDSSHVTTGVNGVVQTNSGSSASAAMVAAHIVICRRGNAFCGSTQTNLKFFGAGGAMNNESAHYTNVRNLLLALGVTGI